MHWHRLTKPYRCATGGLRRARPVRELWLLRRHPVRETSTGLKNRSWTGCARRDRGHGCVGSLHSRGREPWRRTGFGYCPQPGAPRYPCTSCHTNPRSLALVAPRRTGPALCPSLIATRSAQQAHPPTVPSAGRDGRASSRWSVWCAAAAPRTSEGCRSLRVPERATAERATAERATAKRSPDGRTDRPALWRARRA